MTFEASQRQVGAAWWHGWLVIGGLLSLACSSAADSDDRMPGTTGALSMPAVSLAKPKPGAAVLQGPLATLPAATKRRDFRLTPPRVKATRASAARDGTTDVTVVFEADPRLAGLKELVLPLDQGQLVLKAVSTRAANDGSRSFITNVAMPFADVKSTQRRAENVAAKLGEQEIAEFRGREIVGKHKRPQLDDGSGFIPLPRPPVGFVDSARSLMVNHPSVVTDATRTFDPCTGLGTPLGAWTFGKLMTDLAGSMPPGDFVEAWLSTFLSAQTINHFNVAAQPDIFFPPASLPDVLAAWPRLADGSLDLAHAPFKLVAIVNRADLAGNSSYGSVSGAEGRFVFALVQPFEGTCKPVPFNVIFEFGVPKVTCSEMRNWAQQWLSLSVIPIGTPEYNAALQALTDQFATAGADPSKPNGSALNQLRTNAFIGNWFGQSFEKWELRQFHLGQQGGSDALLHPVTVAQTPDAIYDGELGPWGISGVGARAPQLAAWISANVTGTTDPLDAPAYTVPAALPCPVGGSDLPCADMAFRAGSTFSSSAGFWALLGPSAPPNSAMNVFSLNTCDGCHGRETNTFFEQISGDGGLSRFLTGETVSDPRDPSIEHTYNDLLRRKGVLQNLAGAFCGTLPSIPKLVEALVFLSPLPPVEMTPILAVH